MIRISFPTVVAAFLLTIAGCNKKSDPVADPVVEKQYKIAFSSSRENWEIYLMGIDGSNVKRLTTNKTISIYPRWSPDGSKIAYTAYGIGSAKDLYVITSDGAATTKLTTSGGAGFTAPAWSPDGKKLLYVENSQLAVINPNGTGKLTLTGNEYGMFNPSWSPDGSKIVFSQSPTNTYTEDIFIMNADGTGKINLTNNSSVNNNPVWTPDGSKIVFSSSRDTTYEIYSMNADGSNLKRLTKSLQSKYSPVVSPSGTSIIFVSGISGGDYEIYSMNLDGTNLKQLSNVPNYAQQNSISWHKALDKIIFVEAEQPNGGSHLNVWMIDPDGTHQTKITSYDGINNDPAISPVPVQ